MALFGRRLSAGQLVALDRLAAVAYPLVLAATALTRPPDRPVWLELLVVGAIGLPLAVRRRWPWSVFAVVAVANVVALALDVVHEPFFAAAFALYLAALRTPPHRREPTLVIGVVSMVGLAGIVLVGFPPGTDTSAVPLVIGFVLMGAAWTVGRAVQERREYARRYSDELTDRAATEERLRIARDLHDVVSHTLSLIGVKAGVARHVADQRPDEVQEALRVIETTSREALTEMRRMLGVLRAEPARAGVGALPELADRAATAGVPVALAVTGVDGLPGELAQEVYRLVQEALTNVISHAGPASCRVVVEGSDRGVRVEVTDDGAGRVTAGPGYGLIGMRERVARHSGTFAAGPRPEGGFGVTAWLPARAVAT